MDPASDKDFSAISTTFFLKLSGALPFDVFIQRAASTYSKLFRKGDLVDQERMKTYTSQKGVQSLFVHSLEYQVYLTQFEKMAQDILGSLTPERQADAIGLLGDMTELVAQDLQKNALLGERSAAMAVDTVKGCLSLFAKNPSALVRILQYVSRHPYQLRHTLTVTVFSVLLARAEGMVSERSLLAIGLGALFHDAGMGFLSFKSEEREALTPQEWKELKTHPQLGAKLLDGVGGIPEEARLIVLQHHEQPNGQGYPDGISSLHIYPPAKIVGVADAFAALITPRPYREHRFTSTEAIDVLRKDQGKFDRKLVDKLASVFAPTTVPNS